VLQRERKLFASRYGNTRTKMSSGSSVRLVTVSAMVQCHVAAVDAPRSVNECPSMADDAGVCSVCFTVSGLGASKRKRPSAGLTQYHVHPTLTISREPRTRNLLPVATTFTPKQRKLEKEAYVSLANFQLTTDRFTPLSTPTLRPQLQLFHLRKLRTALTKSHQSKAL
jgi:hypothetical protein